MSWYLQAYSPFARVPQFERHELHEFSRITLLSSPFVEIAEIRVCCFPASVSIRVHPWFYLFRLFTCKIERSEGTSYFRETSGLTTPKHQII